MSKEYEYTLYAVTFRGSETFLTVTFHILARSIEDAIATANRLRMALNDMRERKEYHEEGNLTVHRADDELLSITTVQRGVFLGDKCRPS
jgi:hypothetical protein